MKDVHEGAFHRSALLMIDAPNAKDTLAVLVDHPNLLVDHRIQHLSILHKPLIKKLQKNQGAQRFPTS